MNRRADAVAARSHPKRARGRYGDLRRVQSRARDSAASTCVSRLGLLYGTGGWAWFNIQFKQWRRRAGDVTDHVTARLRAVLLRWLCGRIGGVSSNTFFVRSDDFTFNALGGPTPPIRASILKRSGSRRQGPINQCLLHRMSRHHGTGISSIDDAVCQVHFRMYFGQSVLEESNRALRQLLSPPHLPSLSHTVGVQQ